MRFVLAEILQNHSTLNERLYSNSTHRAKSPLTHSLSIIHFIRCFADTQAVAPVIDVKPPYTHFQCTRDATANKN